MVCIQQSTTTVTVEGLTIASQTIGVVDQSNGLTGLDGILGLGPDDLTLNSIVNESGVVISTVPDASNRYVIDFIFADHNILESRQPRKNLVCIDRNLHTSGIRPAICRLA